MTASKLVQPKPLSTRPSRARQEVRAILGAIGWAGDADEVVLAVHEALVNAQRHAGAALRAEMAVDEFAVVVRVWDAGPGFDLEPHVGRVPEPLAERGRGLWLIDRVTTRCEVGRDDEGVVLEMRFARP